MKGDKRPWREGLTVQELLRSVGLEGRLVYVRVNGHRVGPPEWKTFQVPDVAAVDILPVVLGG